VKRLSSRGSRMSGSEVSTGVQTPDEALVSLAQRGDRGALEVLFLRYRSMAHGLAFRLLGNEQDAQDAVQDGFLKAFRNIRSFDGRSQFQTWLVKIVHNAALDLGRRRKRRHTLSLVDGTQQGQDIDPPCEDDPSKGMHQQDLRRLLNAALERLSPSIRETFILFAETGLSYKEIAEVQEIPIGTVMSRLNHARNKLQKFLDLGGLDRSY